MQVETKQEEMDRVVKDGSEAEKLLSHPMIEGFFSKEIGEIFNSFCTLMPGASYENYLRLHMEVHSLLNLKAKLTAYVAEKAAALDRERIDTKYMETET